MQRTPIEQSVLYFFIDKLLWQSRRSRHGEHQFLIRERDFSSDSMRLENLTVCAWEFGSKFTVVSVEMPNLYSCNSQVLLKLQQSEDSKLLIYFCQQAKPSMREVCLFDPRSESHRVYTFPFLEW